MLQIPDSTRHAGALALLAGTFLIAACSGGGGGGSPFTGGVSELPVSAGNSGGSGDPGGACSFSNQTQAVLNEMRTEYLWDDFVGQDASASSFNTPEALLDGLKRRASQGPGPGESEGVDDTYSFIANAAEFNALLQDGQFVGFGYRAVFDDQNNYVVLLAFGGSTPSPAAQAGFQRGTRIEQINGTAPTPDNIAQLLGPSDAGITRTFTIRQPGAAGTTDVDVTKDTVTIDSTQVVQRFTTTAGTNVGYLLFTNFQFEKSRRELQAAFDVLDGDNSTPPVDELILDLRYNGGGSVSTSEVLASLIAGRSGEVFGRAVQNDNPDRQNNYGFTLRLRDTDEQDNQTVTLNTLGLDRVYVITTRATASASELVINGLAPFLDVVVVGDTTFGKPVGQFGKDFCDKTLALVNFQTLNADGDGAFFKGIPVDCAASDDTSNPLTLDANTGNEASIQAALDAINSPATCAVAVAQRRVGETATQQVFAAGDGFRQLIGAY